MMNPQALDLNGVPALLWGRPADALYLYVHGKDGSKEDAARFAALADQRGWQVLSLDLPEHGARRGQAQRLVPWQAVPELQAAAAYARERWQRLGLYAVSIGAWFSLLALAEQPPVKSLLESPILDMQLLIERMMEWAGVGEGDLREQGRIPTPFGETLDWQYYLYSREHQLPDWPVPSAVLYGGLDTLTDRATVEAFCRRWPIRLTVMEEGEHWFHTPEQLALWQAWAEENA